mmetsp:Transcript_16524/g.35617  ORF Transcript_16524/g.35617 Transcript_16524/m.35617 type:complete len:166 (+) Transcript_16524:1223-1720(+)
MLRQYANRFGQVQNRRKISSENMMSQVISIVLMVLASKGVRLIVSSTGKVAVMTMASDKILMQVKPPGTVSGLSRKSHTNFCHADLCLTLLSERAIAPNLPLDLSDPLAERHDPRTWKDDNDVGFALIPSRRSVGVALRGERHRFKVAMAPSFQCPPRSPTAGST